MLSALLVASMTSCIMPDWYATAQYERPTSLPAYSSMRSMHSLNLAMCLQCMRTTSQFAEVVSCHGHNATRSSAWRSTCTCMHGSSKPGLLHARMVHLLVQSYPEQHPQHCGSSHHCTLAAATTAFALGTMDIPTGKECAPV